MSPTTAIQAILNRIDNANRFLVAAHSGPDGDAMASTLALTCALRELGKDVVAYNRDGVPPSFAFLPGAGTVVTEVPAGSCFDVGFVLDSGELERAGGHLKESCRELVNIDHHPCSETFGSVNYVDEQASATGALIYRILKEGDIPLSVDVALCIYTAILSDTGSFRYSNANPEAFRIAAELVELGVDPWQVAGGLYESQDEERLRLLAQALGTLDVSHSGRFASITLTDDMMRAAGATAEHTDGFVNYPRSIRGVEVSVIFRQVSPDSYKVGFRSKGAVDVGALARALGGGGHHNAAGAVVSGTLDEVKRHVDSCLNNPEGSAAI